MLQPSSPPARKHNKTWPPSTLGQKSKYHNSNMRVLGRHESHARIMAHTVSFVSNISVDTCIITCHSPDLVEGKTCSKHHVWCFFKKKRGFLQHFPSTNKPGNTLVTDGHYHFSLDSTATPVTIYVVWNLNCCFSNSLFSWLKLH